MSVRKVSLRIYMALALCVVMVMPNMAFGEEAALDTGAAPNAEATSNAVPEPVPAAEEDPVVPDAESNDAIMYTVQFLDKDGSVLKSEQVEEGQAATAPEPPEHVGWRFIGWVEDYSYITTDLTVYPEYRRFSPQGSFLGSSTVDLGNPKDLVFVIDTPYDPSVPITVGIESASSNPIYRDATFSVTGDATSTTITVHADSLANLEPGRYLLWCFFSTEFSSVGEFEIVAAEAVPVAATQQGTGLAKTGDSLPVGLATVGGAAFAGLAGYAIYRTRKHI